PSTPNGRLTVLRYTLHSVNTSSSSFFSRPRPPPPSTLFPYTTLFRSVDHHRKSRAAATVLTAVVAEQHGYGRIARKGGRVKRIVDRKSTRLNSSHRTTSYAVFCLKKKNTVCPPHGRHEVPAVRIARQR